MVSQSKDQKTTAPEPPADPEPEAPAEEPAAEAPAEAEAAPAPAPPPEPAPAPAAQPSKDDIEAALNVLAEDAAPEVRKYARFILARLGARQDAAAVAAAASSAAAAVQDDASSLVRSTGYGEDWSWAADVPGVGSYTSVGVGEGPWDTKHKAKEAGDRWLKAKLARIAGSA